MSPPDVIPGAVEVLAALTSVRSGTPAVLRFSGDPAAALAAAGVPVTARWRVDQVPVGGEFLWFAEGAANEAAADVAIAGAVLLQVPTLIILSGRNAQERGLPVGATVDGGAPGDAEPTYVDGLEVPAGVSDLEAEVEAAMDDGRLVVAAALLRVLEERAPDAAGAHRWIHVARVFYLARPDCLSVVREVLADPSTRRRSRILTMAAQVTMDGGVSLHLLRQAVRCAETESERQDARYYRNRTQIRVGQRAVNDAGEPASRLFLAMARFGTASREAYRHEEPGPANAALASVGTAAAAAQLAWVNIRFDTAGGDWNGAARRLIGLGLVRSAGWLLSESIQYRPDNARLSVGLAVLDSPRMVRALELTQLLGEFDAVRARRLAPSISTHDNVVSMRCFGRVLDAASAAVLDEDAGPLAELHRPEIREQLQPAFCTILVDAAASCSRALAVQLMALAVDWSASVESLADRRSEWIATMEEWGRSELESVPLGAYALRTQFESGGMGSVWHAEHVRLGQPVAIKFLKPDAIAHAGAFAEEVALLASLDHPAVVQVLDLGEVTEATQALSNGALVAGTPYLVMELVSAGTLSDYRGQLAWSDVRDLLLAMLDALAYVHARGILHRDLKPANILVGTSDTGLTVRLSDFGLSVDAMAGRVVGTPMYMAPEQFIGAGLGPWTDLYAVGCVATALLTGLPPFLGAPARLRHAHLERPVPSLETDVLLPEGFDAWRRRLLAKAPQDRFGHARAATLGLLALPDAPAGTPVRRDPSPSVPQHAFSLRTLVGKAVDAAPTRVALPHAGTEVLPAVGFVDRPLRPRLPTDQLFGRFPSPCLGQIDVRQAIWDAARRAVQEGSVETLEVHVPAGLSLARVLSWARRRTRELGVDVSADDGAAFQLGEARPAHGPGVWVRAVDDAPLALRRLDPIQAVAQLRLQVNLTPDLAWTLAARTHGLPDLIDAVLAEVIAHPGLISTDDGLAACGALPELFAAETSWARQVLEQLPEDVGRALERAAIAPPGSPHEPEGVPDALLAGPVGGRWLAEGLRLGVSNEVLSAGRAEALHREALERPDLTGFARGWHLLGVGEPELAEPFLRSALPDAKAVGPLGRVLDLQLVSADDPRRPRASREAESTPPPPGIAPIGRLEWMLRHGRREGRAALVASILARRKGGVEWEVLDRMCGSSAHR